MSGHEQLAGDEDPVRVVAVAASLRRGSVNGALLDEAVRRAPSGLVIEVVPIHDVPLYNGDLDVDGGPAGVVAIKAAAAAADGVLVATPQYNHAIAGVTKNLIDWWSRPMMEGPLLGRAAMVMAASPSRHEPVEAIEQARQGLRFCGATVLEAPDVAVASWNHVLDESGRLADTSVLARLDDALGRFLELCRAARAAR